MKSITRIENGFEIENVDKNHVEGIDLTSLNPNGEIQEIVIRQIVEGKELAEMIMSKAEAEQLIQYLREQIA